MKKKKILVVEDDGIIASDIAESLENLGYEVVAIAASGEEALKMMKEKKPDLILMDIVLQGTMNGISAAGYARSKFKLPVVYLTSYSDDETLERAKVTEPFGYVMKPFEDRELHSIIEMALYRHQMERKLKDSEEWLSTMLSSIGDAVIATGPDGCVIFMNPVSQSLTGWTEEEAVGKPLEEVFKIINEYSRQEVESPVTKVLKEGIVVGLANHTLLITKGGFERPIDDSGAPIRNSDGDIIGVVLVFRDISEKKRLEEDLMRARKLESVGILAGGIAHDFNNLLTAILGNISLAQMDIPKKSEAFERLADAEKASMRAQDLTGQLLTFSKGGEPVKSVVYLPELVKDSAGFALRGSNVKCEFSFPKGLWLVETDEGQISQVINNIIINADQSMPEGGTISVSVRNLRVTKADALPMAEGDYSKISIKDQGLGISEEHLLKIFDPYFTTKQVGSGLGLATSYSIVKRHDGHIEVESKLAAGTTFHVYLPASSGAVLSEKKEETQPVTGKGRILIMDDEKNIRNFVTKALRKIGYECETANHGLEAIELYKQARESGHPFEAAIMDLTIPGGMGGKETIKRLLEIDPEARAIVSSGYSNDPVIANYEKHGFKGYMAKPYTIQEISMVLHEVLKKKES